MFRTIGCFVLMVFCAIIGQANGQADCAPLSVVDVGITGNGTLYWSISPNETCVIEHFIVNIQFTFGDIESTLVTVTPSVDISFLPPCETWIFSISAVSSDHVAGRIHHLFSKVPMAPGTDLSIRFVSLTHSEEYATLRWEVINSTNADCVDSYRLTVVDADSNSITDREVVGNFAFIRDLAPCTVYQFGVRAIHIALPEEEGPMTIFPYAEPPRKLSPPKLLDLSQGSTYFNSTWTLDEYSKNRCEISAVYVDGSPFFNLTIPVENSPQRGPVAINVDSLQPSSSYIFRVSVENLAGRSEPVAIAVQTRPSLNEEAQEHQ